MEAESQLDDIERERRSEFVMVRVSPAEKRAIEDRARAEETTVSKLVRRLAEAS